MDESKLISTFEMLVTRLTNIEEKLDDRDRQLNRKLEHIDNLREAGAVLSGLIHCDPPRESVIVKHYGPEDCMFAQDEDVDPVVLVTFHGPIYYPRCDSRQRRNSTHDEDLKTLWGSEYFRLKEFIQSGKLKPIGYPEDKEQYQHVFKFNHDCPEGEVCERLVKNRFPSVLAYGYGGIVLKYGTVREIMRTVDDVETYLYGPGEHRNRIHLWYDDGNRGKLLETFVRHNEEDMETCYHDEIFGDKDTKHHIDNMMYTIFQEMTSIREMMYNNDV